MKKAFVKIQALIIILITLALPFCGELCADSVKSGITVCINTLIPSLYPFLFFSGLLASFCPELLSAVFAPILCPLFNISESACSAVVLGTVGGFPAGAQISAELYSKKMISEGEAKRLPVFCNNAGPMFVIVAVGAGCFNSFETGLLLYFVHLAASVVMGIITRPRKKMYSLSKKYVSDTFSGFSPKPIYKIFPLCIASSLKTMGIIVGNFLVFRVLTALITFRLGVSGTPLALLRGLLEITCGIVGLTASRSGIVAAAFILGFNGLCVHMQTASVFSSARLSPLFCILGKAACAAISAVIMYWVMSAKTISDFGHINIPLIFLPICIALLLFGFMFFAKKLLHNKA